MRQYKRIHCFGNCLPYLQAENGFFFEIVQKGFLSSAVHSFCFRCLRKPRGFCRLLLAKLPAVFLMTRAFFTPPFLSL